MRGVVIAAVCVSFSMGLASEQGPPSELTADDRLVWQAVLMHTVMPEARRLSRNPIPLPVLSRTVAVCEVRHDHTCITRDQLGRFLKEVIGNWVLGPEPGVAIPTSANRAALIASLAKRNAARTPFSIEGMTDLTVIPFESDHDVMVRDRDTSRYAGLTLPAYDSDRHALVYAFYACGARCGSGWLFLLEKRGVGWQVQSRYMLWIR